VTNPAKAKKKRQRLRLIEGFLLDGYGAQEITDMLPKGHGAAYGTIRNNIVEVRESWAADVDARDELEGRHRYLSALRQVRKRALEGWEEEGKFGIVVKGVDLGLVHTVDKEVARFSGVNLKIDDRTINLNLKAAVAHMEDILKAIFSVIQDPDQQDRVIEAIDAIADE